MTNDDLHVYAHIKEAMVSNIDERFAEILEEHGLDVCKECDKTVDRSDVAWNNASTEAGTPCATLEIICAACSNSILHIFSWWPGIETF